MAAIDFIRANKRPASKESRLVRIPRDAPTLAHWRGLFRAGLTSLSSRSTRTWAAGAKTRALLVFGGYLADWRLMFFRFHGQCVSTPTHLGEKKMTTYYVATRSCLVLIEAADEGQARELGRPPG